MRDTRRAQRRADAAKIKGVRSLHQRRNDLWHAATTAVAVVPLPEPIHAGWVRYFAIRPDLRHTADEPYLERILRLVQNEEPCSRRGEVKARDWRRGGRLRSVAHRPKKLDAGDYWQLPEKLRSYFQLSVGRDSRGHITKPSFELVHPWKLVSRVSPAYITHRGIPNAEALSAHAWVENKLTGPRWLLRHYLRAVGSGGYWDRYPDNWQEMKAARRGGSYSPDEALAVA